MKTLMCVATETTQIEGFPPLCPRTEEAFNLHSHQESYPDAHVMGTNSDHTERVLFLAVTLGMDRRFLARYQACAWMDRAKRWGNEFLGGEER